MPALPEIDLMGPTSSATSLVDGTRNSVYLLARSPASPVSKTLLRQLPSYAQRNLSVYVIFHRTDNIFSERRFINEYKSAFGSKAIENIRLARQKEIRMMNEFLQFGVLLAWTGGKISDPPRRLKDFNAEESRTELTEFDVKLAESTFSRVWQVADSLKNEL